MSVLVAAVGTNVSDLFLAIKEFTIEKIILICYPEKCKEETKLLKELEKFKMDVETVRIESGNIWEETFRIINSIKKAHEGKDILIDVSSGNEITRCAMTSASFVNGIKAFATTGSIINMLPILKFSYYKLITDRKMRILETLFQEKDCCASMEDLSKKCKMSLPLVSYHINGNPKSEGLKKMALVDTEQKKGRIEIKLSLMGKLLMKGYVD